MLNDPLFEDNDENVIDESLTFFIAGTITQATALSNAISYIIQNPNVEKKLRESLSKNFSTFKDSKATLDDMA